MSFRAKGYSNTRWVTTFVIFSLAFMATKCGQSRVTWSDAPEFRSQYDDAGVEGVFVLHRAGSKEYRTNDRKRATTRYLPASTFKIFNALVALETGVVADASERIEWDGVERQVSVWNQDHDLASAISVSAVWYFQELARRIGEERMQLWIDRVGYGNQDIGGPADLFWLRGDLRISPLEQVVFLERLSNNDLPFSQRSMDIVKRILLRDSTDEWTLRGKTGWGTQDDFDVGWFVGYVERGNEVWVFANNLTIENNEDGSQRVGLARRILETEGLISVGS